MEGISTRPVGPAFFKWELPPTRRERVFFTDLVSYPIRLDKEHELRSSNKFVSSTRDSIRYTGKSLERCFLSSNTKNSLRSAGSKKNYGARVISACRQLPPTGKSRTTQQQQQDSFPSLKNYAECLFTSKSTALFQNKRRNRSTMS